MNGGPEPALHELLGPRTAASLAPSLCQLASFRHGPQMFLLPGSVVAVPVLGWGHGAGLRGVGAWVSGQASPVMLSAGPCPRVLLLAGRLPPPLGTAGAKVWSHLCGYQEPRGPRRRSQVKRQHARGGEVTPWALAPWLQSPSQTGTALGPSPPYDGRIKSADPWIPWHPSQNVLRTTPGPRHLVTASCHCWRQRQAWLAAPAGGRNWQRAANLAKGPA